LAIGKFMPAMSALPAADVGQFYKKREF